MGEEGPADLHTAVRPRGVWGWKLRTGIKQRTPSSNNRRKMMREKRRNSFYNSAEEGGHVWRRAWWRERRNRGSSATDETSREYIRRPPLHLLRVNVLESLSAKQDQIFSSYRKEWDLLRQKKRRERMLILWILSCFSLGLKFTSCSDSTLKHQNHPETYTICHLKFVVWKIILMF